MMTKKIASGKRTLKQQGRKAAMQLFMAGSILCMGGIVQSCEKDILTGQPEWLGNSIYERLGEGITTTDGKQCTFNYTVRLINDLEYTETLSKTGSKTLFATPDHVFEAWLQAKGKKYEDLTMAEKKQIFKNSMINNAYLLNLMSNSSGNPPQEGQTMRRETEASIYDNIPQMSPDDMPLTEIGDPKRMPWEELIAGGSVVNIMKDATAAPMIHFLPDFMQQNDIQNEDLQIISNGESSSVDDAWVAGKKVISKEQTCKNGYIYVIDGVIEGTTNMADMIHKLPNTKWWAKALDRFSCPVEITDQKMLANYHGLTGTDGKLYQLRYFNNSSNHALTKGDGWDSELNAGELLRFDPGWNLYSQASSGKDYHYDAGVMIVPTDEALEDWWNNGGGKDLKEYYGSWEDIDASFMAKLINVNMQESFIASVPSRFSSVLDYTSQRPIAELSKENIAQCIMCCNGIIYLVNKIHVPDENNTVLYPTNLKKETSYSVIGRALNGEYESSPDQTKDFSPYLASLDSKLGLIVPFNEQDPLKADQRKGKVFRIFDPCSAGTSKELMLEFYYANGKVQGQAYVISRSPATGDVTVDLTRVTPLSTSVVKNRLYDLIDNNVIIGTITSDREFFKTKTGAYIRAYNDGGQLTMQGGLQLETGEEIAVPQECIVDKLQSQGNGVTYGVASAQAMEGQPEKYLGIPQTATKSVYQLLNEEVNNSDQQCSEFLEYLKLSDLLIDKEGSYECAGTDNYNIKSFESYNYTVYVPTNDVIEALKTSHVLPTKAEYDKAKADYKSDPENETNKKKFEKAQAAITNFVRYHLQDNSVVLKSGAINNDFETNMLNPTDKRFYTLKVVSDGQDISVTDAVGNTAKLVKDSRLNNKMARECWILNKGKGTNGVNATIESSSFVVLQQINKALIYSPEQLKPWEQ